MQNELSGPDDQSVPWTASEIFAALFLVYWFWVWASYQALLWTGFYQRLYGPELLTLAEDYPKTNDQDEVQRRQRRQTALGLAAGPTASEVLPLLRQLAYYRTTLWATALAFPFQAVTIPLLFFAVSRTRPDELGLTTRRWGRNLLAGALGALLLTPLVIGLNWAVAWGYRAWTGDGVEEHPLTRLAGQPLWPAEWALWVFSAVVAAAVVEELVFRGMLQPWLARQPWGGHGAVLLAGVVALLSRVDRIQAGWLEGGWTLLEGCLPALFVLALVPVYLVVCRRSRSPAGPAVFATALLFASVHSFAWPTPVALFVLALGLGVLAWRTQSLVGPIVLHSLFNGVNCLLLVWLLWTQPDAMLFPMP